MAYLVESAWNKSESDVLDELGSGSGGLRNGEADERLAIYGRNEIKESKSKGALDMFIDQFRNFLVIILI